MQTMKLVFRLSSPSLLMKKKLQLLKLRALQLIRTLKQRKKSKKRKKKKTRSNLWKLQWI
jgi:hypothetical protein